MDPSGFPKTYQRGNDVKSGPFEKVWMTVQTYNTGPARSSVRESRLRRFYEFLRWDVYTTYRQLWCLVVAGNVVAAAIALHRNIGTDNPATMILGVSVNAAIANLLAGILIRQDYIKNFLFWVCWSIPQTSPLWLRIRLALVYENGGVHSGCGASLLLWTLMFTSYLWVDFAQDGYHDSLVLATDIILVVLMLTIIVGAVPQVRRRYHNSFERTHRWGGWLGIGFLWIAVVQFTSDESRSHLVSQQPSLASKLLNLPAFWMLLLVTAQTIYSWIHLRKVAVVKAHRLSDHAIRVWFSPDERIYPLRGVAISDNPLFEWHGFAAIADSPNPKGSSFSIIVSKAGDWTSRMIECPRPYYYMRGVHSIGVVAMAKLFKSIILMGTGSGVGPCIAVHGLLPNTKVRFIWSSPSPRDTFGDEICDQVYKMDPHALIWDTRLPGKKRPNLTELAYHMYCRDEGEAVFFISNRNLTRKIIRGLRQLGVPAFAPVFDS